VDDVQVLRDLELRIPRTKGLEVFPMDRAAPSGEQSGLGEKERAAADGTDDGAVMRETPQLVVDLDAALDLGCLETGARDDHVGLVELGERALGRDGDAIAGLHGIAVRRDELPLEEPRPAQAVCGAQGLDGGSEGHHREAGNEQERYSYWHTGGSERHRASFPAGATPGRCANVARVKMRSHALFDFQP